MTISAERALRRAMNDRDEELDKAASEFIGAKVTTEYNILLGSMGMHVTSRDDGQKLTEAQKAYIQGLWMGFEVLEGIILYYQQPANHKKRKV